MSFHSIRTISFDATGTLFDPYPSIGAIYADVLQDQGIFMTEPELEMRFLAEFHKSRDTALNRVDESVERTRWEEVLEGILADNYSETIFEALWQALGSAQHWKPKPRLFRTLTTLQDAGYQLIILSNWDKRLYTIVDELKLSPFFSRVFISTELSVEKPSEKFYEKVASELNMEPTTLLHVGNSPVNDFKPALRSGWNALLLHNRIPHGFEPGSVLGSIDQLPEVLKSEQVTAPAQ